MSGPNIRLRCDEQTSPATGKAHVLVRGVTVEGGLVNGAGQDLDVATTAVDLLLVLDGILDDELLALVAELGELGGDLVEAGILRGVQTWQEEQIRASSTNTVKVLAPLSASASLKNLPAVTSNLP